MNQATFCSTQALNTGAQLYGTASHVDMWLLIEYAQNWHAKANSNNSLPDAVNKHLAQLPIELEKCSDKKLRIAFIKQASRTIPLQPRIMLAYGSPNQTQLISTTLSNHADIFSITANDLLHHQLPNGEKLLQEIYLICTNGQRDLCCGRLGIPLYKHLHKRFNQRIWQVTHIGGHRFAANVLCLPSGIVYGFVEPKGSYPLINNMDNNLLSLMHLRGRSSYPPEAQAAEYFLLKHMGYRENNALKYIEGEISAQYSELRFHDKNNHHYSVKIQRKKTNAILPSCDAEPKPSFEFKLCDISPSN